MLVWLCCTLTDPSFLFCSPPVFSCPAAPLQIHDIICPFWPAVLQPASPAGFHFAAPSLSSSTDSDFIFVPWPQYKSKPKDLISKLSQIINSCYCHKKTVPNFFIPKLALLHSQSLLPLRVYFPTLQNLLCIVRLCSSTLSSGFVNCSPDMV